MLNPRFAVEWHPKTWPALSDWLYIMGKAREFRVQELELELVRSDESTRHVNHHIPNPHSATVFE
jgi:hypothetical protein